jgi:membrane fusion protein, copper/silver efflux system
MTGMSQRFRTARRLRCLATLALALLALAVVVAACAKKESGAEYYCPMHPTYVSDRPGDCPICNMRLVKREPAARAPGAGAGRDTARAGAAGGAEANQRPLYYRSPMDPRVTSPVPAKDEMGMDFVPVYADAVERTTIPGMAPVTLDSVSRRLAGIQTAVAVQAPLLRTVRTVGIVQPDESRLHHVHTKVAGYIEKLYVNVTGQYVKQGDPVFDLYSPELLASQEELLRARETVQQLADSSIPEVRRGAADLLLAARRRLQLFDVPDAIIAEIEQTGTARRTLPVRAHGSGYVLAKMAVEGQQVEPGAELFTLADLSRVWVEADFYEYEARLVHAGQMATVTLPYDPTSHLSGRVAYIYPFVDPRSRTLKVRFEFGNADLKLKPDMFVDVTLDVETARNIVVPESAVLDTGVRQIVFVESVPGRFVPRAVQVGLKSDGQTEILSGLQAGETVVVSANFLLDSESRLRGAALGGPIDPGAEVPALPSPTPPPPEGRP